MMKPTRQLPDEVREHFEGFCRSFLSARVRDRKLAKPDELLSDLCHRAVEMVHPRTCMPLAGKISNRVDVLLDLVESLTTTKTVAYLSSSNDYGNGLCFLAEAVGRLRFTNAVLLSIEPGRFAFYATEGCPKSDWYLLCDDPKRLAKAAQLAEQLGRRS